VRMDNLRSFDARCKFWLVWGGCQVLRNGIFVNWRG
jgi:hypothetical protein